METDSNDEKLDRLFATARKTKLYKTDMEYGFETRVMEKILAKRERQMPFLLWVWRLIPVFVSIVIFLGIWIYSSRHSSMADLSAITEIGNEETTLVTFLTGE